MLSQLSCDLTGAFGDTQIQVGREETGSPGKVQTSDVLSKHEYVVFFFVAGGLFVDCLFGFLLL